MNAEIQIDSKAKANNSQKKPYTAPNLVSYGAVSMLTQNGSKNGKENQGNTAGSA